jgi:hypothetical protein
LPLDKIVFRLKGLYGYLLAVSKYTPFIFEEYNKSEKPKKFTANQLEERQKKKVKEMIEKILFINNENVNENEVIKYINALT